MSAETAEREKLMQRYGRQFSAGSVLFRDGDSADEAYLLEAGRVRLFKQIGGMERSLRLVRPGELFGETALLPGARRSATALALDDGIALAFDTTSFDEIVFSHPSITRHVVQELVQRLREAEDQMEILKLDDARSKVLVALLKLGESQSSPDLGASAAIEVSPLELSARVSLDVESVKRIVLGLKDSGHVRIVDERIEIPDLDTLRDLNSLLGVRDQLRGTHGAEPGRGTTR
jgi:CRP-like cAMP-binding protein